MRIQRYFIQIVCTCHSYKQPLLHFDISTTARIASNAYRIRYEIVGQGTEKGRVGGHDRLAMQFCKCDAERLFCTNMLNVFTIRYSFDGTIHARNYYVRFLVSRKKRAHNTRKRDTNLTRLPFGHDGFAILEHFTHGLQFF